MWPEDHLGNAWVNRSIISGTDESNDRAGWIWSRISKISAGRNLSLSTSSQRASPGSTNLYTIGEARNKSSAHTWTSIWLGDPFQALLTDVRCGSNFRILLVRAILPANVKVCTSIIAWFINECNKNPSCAQNIKFQLVQVHGEKSVRL